MYRKFSVLAFLVIGMSGFASAGVLKDFKDYESPKLIFENEKRLQKFEIVNESKTKEKVGKITWDESAYRFAEITTRSKDKFPEFSKASVKVRVCIPKKKTVSSIGLRLQDAKGEVFQWTQKIDSKNTGWQDVVFNITPQNFNVAWGSKSDKKFDQASRLFGLGATFIKGSGKGSLLVRDITLVSSE